MTEFKNEYRKALDNIQPTEQSLNELLVKMQKQSEQTKKAKKSPLKIVLPLTSIAAAAACVCLAVTCVITFSSSDGLLSNSAPSGEAPNYSKDEIGDFGFIADSAAPDGELREPDNDDFAEEFAPEINAPSENCPSVEDAAGDNSFNETKPAVLTTTPAYLPDETLDETLSEESANMSYYVIGELYPNAVLESVRDENELALDQSLQEVADMLLKEKASVTPSEITEEITLRFAFSSENGSFEIVIGNSLENAYLCADGNATKLQLSDEIVKLIKAVRLP